MSSATEPRSDSPRKPPLRFGSEWTVVGLVTGIVIGIVFGEYCAPLRYIGDAFIGLLRMTVMPYIVVSLIANFGRLSLHQSRRLAVVGGAVMVTLWTIGLVTVYAVPHCLPSWKSGSFFSTVITDPPPSVDLIRLFIPENVFASLAENQVPAVVLLCICVGLALAPVKQKEVLILQLDVLAKALIRVSTFVARWTPVGVFAIAASTAGTLSWAELSRLQAYLVMFTFSSLFLLLVVLPWFITICTPFRPRDVWFVSKDAVITAFATGKLLVVLPILIEQTEHLCRMRSENKSGAEQDQVTCDVLFPLAYPFPHLGKLMGMLFIPFAAWFLGNAMKDYEYPAFLFAGLFSYFGGPVLATPFLLDQMHLPHDMFQLFILSGVYCGRLGDALGVMHLVAFTLISLSAFNGTLQLPKFRLVRFTVATTLIGVSMVVGMRAGLARTLKSLDEREDVLAHMQLLIEPVESEVLSVQAPNPDPLLPGETLLQRIERRGTIRIGFNPDKLPFAYFNVNGELVGFDINMAHYLARDLGVSIEFVRFDRKKVSEQLAADHFDIVMSGLVGTLDRARSMGHTRSYLDLTLSLVVEDYRSRDFATIESIRKMSDVRIGFVDLSRGFVERLRDFLPNITLVELPNNRAFFEGDYHDLDGLLISAESGSAFTLFYPDFEVVIPAGANRVSLPLFYAIGNRDAELQNFMEHWLELRTKDGTLQDNYDHWILGKNLNGNKARWSLIRYLGWVP